MEKKTVLTYINKSIILATEQCITHQCNCISVDRKGLAADIFSNFPYSDTYKLRADGSRNTPGTISIHQDLKNRNAPTIINMYAQYYPGKREFNNDNKTKRELWFKECLDKIANVPGIESIAFPVGIGCRLAGGDWGGYLSMIEEFATANKKIRVVMYKYDS